MLETILQDQQVIKSALTTMAQYYHENLLNDDRALKYSQDRNIDKDTYERFMIGFSRSSESTMRMAEVLNITHDALCIGGILSGGDFGRDRFVGRLVFPIFDLQGSVISFSGRTIRDEKPKYINGPSTSVFKKSLSLYGLFQASESIEKEGFVVLVEGAMDVIALHKIGITNVVAPCGVATRLEHIYMIKHFTNNLVCCFDNDHAGQESAAKVEKLCETVGLDFQYFQVDGAKDVDEFIKKFGPSSLIEVFERIHHE